MLLVTEYRRTISDSLKSHYRIFFFILVVFSFTGNRMMSQSNPIAADHITIEQGLSQSTVNCILQDSPGFMWFGTQDGLNKYDGYRFTVYRNSLTDSSSICNNYISDGMTDRSGRFWIATAQGLALFEVNHNRFTCYTHMPDNEKSLSDNYVRALAEDSSGNIWIGTANGLTVYENSRDVFSRVPIDSKHLVKENILSLCVVHDGSLWIGLNDGQAFRLDISDLKKTTVLDRISQWNNKERTVNNNIWTIFEDRRHNIWFGTELGLYLYEPTEKRWTHYEHKMSDPGSLTDNSTRQIFEDRYEVLWIGTNQGLDQFDRKTGRFIHISTSGFPYTGTPNDRIRRIFEDRQGRLWIGTDGEGVIKLDRHKHKFHHILRHPVYDYGLSHNMVLSVAEDREGILWIGTLGGGLNQFDRNRNRWTYYRNDPARPGTISDDNVRALVFDSRGLLWIGTLQGGLNRLDPVSGRCIRFVYRADDVHSLSNNAVTALLHAQSGVLWIGTYNGLNQWDEKNKRFVRYLHDENDTGSISHNQIRTLFEDNTGNLWIGTFGGGLNRMDKASRRFRVFQHRPGDLESLNSNIIRSIHQDRKNRMWIGSDRGLNLLDPESGRCVRFDERHHLPNNVIYAILEDVAGLLWISSNNGLARFNPDSLASLPPLHSYANMIRHFTVSDGLQSLEFNQSAACITARGEMFFGGINGLNYFFPDSIRDNPNIPPLAWTGFRIFNRPESALFNSGLTGRLELSYDDNYFTVEFAALDYTDPARNRYAYKMEGFDKEWVDAGTRRFAGYTNLDGGEYVFRVKGSNSDGVWNDQGIAMSVVIIPPWWQQWWFRGLLVLFVIGITYLVFRIRTEMIRNRNRQLEILVAERTNDLKIKTIRLQEANAELLKLNEKKNEFLGIAAHDIRNPLGAIINFTQVILRDLQSRNIKPDETKQDLKSILAAAEQSRNLVNALLDITAIESGKVNLELHQENMADILTECELRHRRHAAQKKIHLEISSRNDLPLIIVDRTRITEVMDNLLSNALKFTYPGGEVRVFCESGPDSVVTRVQDNGQGLNERDLQEIFNSFKKLSARPTGGESSTGLGLAIVKKIVELHGGEVWVESRYGEGSTFSFSLPVVESKS